MIIFATHFQLATMSYVSFLSLVFYAYVTISITLWRKKFRQQSTKHDNEYHDKGMLVSIYRAATKETHFLVATDALINYETIKYFTNEKHEIDLYSGAIQKYQSFSVSVQASLSVLNISQTGIIQATILACLALAIPHVIEQDGRGVDLGAFVAITVYLQNLFSPLYFLGSLYNMMINVRASILSRRVYFKFLFRRLSTCKSSANSSTSTRTLSTHRTRLSSCSTMTPTATASRSNSSM